MSESKKTAFSTRGYSSLTSLFEHDRLSSKQLAAMRDRIVSAIAGVEVKEWAAAWAAELIEKIPPSIFAPEWIEEFIVYLGRVDHDLEQKILQWYLLPKVTRHCSCTDGDYYYFSDRKYDRDPLSVVRALRFLFSLADTGPFNLLESTRFSLLVYDLVRANRFLYWTTPGVRDYHQKVLRRFLETRSERPKYSEEEWTIVERVLRTIVAARHWSMLPEVESVCNCHADLDVDCLNNQTDFARAERVGRLQEMVSLLKNAERESPTKEQLAGALKEAHGYHGLVTLDFNFPVLETGKRAIEIDLKSTDSRDKMNPYGLHVRVVGCRGTTYETGPGELIFRPGIDKEFAGWEPLDTTVKVEVGYKVGWNEVKPALVLFPI